MQKKRDRINAYELCDVLKRVSKHIYLNSSCDLIAIAISTLYQFTIGGKYMK